MRHEFNLFHYLSILKLVAITRIVGRSLYSCYKSSDGGRRNSSHMVFDAISEKFILNS